MGTPWGYELDADLKPFPMIFIAAYGNSIRAFVTYREDIANEIIPGLEIPMGHSIGLQVRCRSQAGSRGLENKAGVVIPGLEIPSGTPLVYEVEVDLKPFPDDFSSRLMANPSYHLEYLGNMAVRSSLAWRSRVALYRCTRSMPTSGRF